MSRPLRIGVAAAGLVFALGCQDGLESPEAPPASAYEGEGTGGSGIPPPAPQQEAQPQPAQQAQPQQQAQQPPQPPQAQQQPQPQAGGDEQTVVGRVASVSENELIVQDTFKKAHKLEITEQTEFIGTGEGLSAKPELLQGVDVRVSFTGEGDRQQATRIEAIRAE